MQYVSNTYRKVVEHINECMTYTMEFCLGKGYREFLCWDCQSTIKVAKRKRWAKCPHCKCLNIHPVWAGQGESIKTFSRKFYVSGVLVLFLLLSYGLGIHWLSKLFY
jgi:hypothetical protein